MISYLQLKGEDVTDPSLIQHEFYQFYTNTFYTEFDRAKINLNIVRKGHILTNDQIDLLTLSFSKEEVKEAMWSIQKNKAPLDGFNSKFYKASWDIVGNNIVAAINQFFQSCKMAKSWNAPTITLIPKVKCPSNPVISNPYLVVMYSTNVFPSSFAQN